MTEFLIKLFENNPWLLYFMLGIIAVVVILFVVGFIQGREISLYPPRIGKKNGRTLEKKQGFQQQTQTININPNLTSEQMDEVADRIATRLIDIRKEVDDKPPSFLYQPPKLHERLEYIYSTRHEIENKVRKLVLSHGGGWAGCSMADFGIYLDYGDTGGILPRDIVVEITDFYNMYTQPIINFEKVSDEEFLNIQYLAAHINMQLDSIPMGPMDTF